MGNYVIIRSSPSGVWFGQLVESERQKYTLKNARRVWSWEGAASCTGLAKKGPTGGKICAPVDVVVHEVCECITATPEAISAFAKIETWE